MLKKNMFNIIFVLTIFFLDRISKFLIIESTELSGELNTSILSFLNFNVVWNDGIAFGLFPFEKSLNYILLTVIIILVTLVIVWLAQKSSGLEKISYLMITGGSLGNIFDRIYYSSVLDFIDININGFHWFIFNVADIFITLGVILLIYLEIFLKTKK
jgi:signal peptidase II|tara:strand:- start:341 stop:814 length:474 start_codon:yes stop_codon:yes gene_type:complete